MWTEKKKSGLMYKRSYQPRSSSTFFYCVCDWIELNWKRIEKEAQLRTTQKIVYTHTHIWYVCVCISPLFHRCVSLCVCLFLNEIPIILVNMVVIINICTAAQTRAKSYIFFWSSITKLHVELSQHDMILPCKYRHIHTERFHMM